MKIIVLILSLAIATVNCDQINESGLKLIKEFEGFYSNFYIDPAVSFKRYTLVIQILN